MSTKNTYNFDCFTDSEKQKEIKRLEHQALLVSSLEQSAINEIGLPQKGLFVDMGCGPGFVSGEIAKHHSNLEVLGLDISDDLLDVAKKVVQPHYSNLTFQKGNSYATALPDNSVDIVYARLLYQHLEFPEKAMIEAKRILKPGGKLCVLDVDDQLQLFYPILPSFKLLQEKAQHFQRTNGGNRHIGRELPHLMKASKFKEIRCLCKNVSTLDIGFDPFFDIVVSFKAQIIKGEGIEILQQLKQEIKELNDQPFGLACVPFVIGVA